MLLSALDQSPVFEGKTPSQALKETIDCAKACDALGMHRYWVAEHHGSESFAGAAPEVLIGSILTSTQNIRVGSGGVMLTHYSPYKVAENFCTLGGLSQGRVDLGIGRAPGGDPFQSGALAYGSKTTTVEFFPNKLSDLLAWIHGAKPETKAFRKVKVTPSLGPPPQPWLLTSSSDSALLAAHFQLPIALAYFITGDCLPLADTYRQHFLRRSEHLAKEGNHDDTKEPRVILACFAMCAESEEEALRLVAPARFWRQNRSILGNFRAFLSTYEAQKKLAELGDKRDTDADTRSLVGTPEQVREKLKNLLSSCEADELMIVTICEKLEDRINSYKKLMEVVQSL